MDLAKLIAERKDAIKSVCAKHGAHDFREGSDIDILVRLDSTNLEGMRYFGVLEELQEELESLLGRKVDVVDEKGLRQKIKADVLAEAIAL
jgi:uncharacterized protein